MIASIEDHLGAFLYCRTPKTYIGVAVELLRTQYGVEKIHAVHHYGPIYSSDTLSSSIHY